MGEQGVGLVTASEFKSWLDGFLAGRQHRPTVKDLDLIAAKAAELSDVAPVATVTYCPWHLQTWWQNGSTGDSPPPLPKIWCDTVTVSSAEASFPGYDNCEFNFLTDDKMWKAFP